MTDRISTKADVLKSLVWKIEVFESGKAKDTQPELSLMPIRMGLRRR